MLNPVVAQPQTIPTVCEEEITHLARCYGTPRRLQVKLPACPDMIKYRFRSQSERRAEVVFAIQNPNDSLWVHTKSHYPSHLYRLPTGGINWDEGVECALLREVSEETSLEVGIQRFLGVIEYFFHFEGRTAHFASYVFHLISNGDDPFPTDPNEKISFQPILPNQLLHISADLRNILGDRRRWGMWRALSHDLVYESLIQ